MTDDAALSQAGSSTTPVCSLLASVRPRFLRPDPALAHLPFLFWLVDVLRPRAAVQLGVGSGTGYFGLCQALDRLGEGAECLGAVDLGAIREGVADLQPDLARYNACHYREFSTLVQGDALSAVMHLSGSLDLLVVSDAVGGVGDAVLDGWLPLLSDRAVIVMYGAVDASAVKAVRDQPVIEAREGGGLRAVLHGPRQDERLRWMATLTLGTPVYANAWHALRRLGDGLVAEAKVDRLETALAAARSHLTSAEKRAKDAEEQLCEAAETSKERYERVADLEAKLFTLETHPRPANEVGVLETRIAELERECVALRAAEATRFKELAVLASMIEEHDAQGGSQLQASRRSGDDAISAALRVPDSLARASDRHAKTLAREAAALLERAEQAERLNEALLASTSWKLTGPIRQVSRLIRKRP